MERIIDQIVEYARPLKLAPARFVLSDLITEVLKRLRGPLQAKHLLVQTSFSTAADYLHGDRDQIEQVLSNVIDNAIEASPISGSAIDIRTTDSFHHELPGIMIRVKDAGKGNPLEVLSRVFESFFTSRKPDGTELGMAICKNIIERHHGHIHLTSTVEIGTIVSIWLPITQEFQLVSGNPSADILVTDNELVIREAIEKRLTRQGHHAVG